MQLWLFTPEVLLHFVQFEVLASSSYLAAKNCRELSVKMQMAQVSMSITLLIKAKCTKIFVTTKLNLEGKGHWLLAYSSLMKQRSGDVMRV